MLGQLESRWWSLSQTGWIIVDFRSGRLVPLVKINLGAGFRADKYFFVAIVGSRLRDDNDCLSWMRL
jgi:hypothetical protein